MNPPGVAEFLADGVTPNPAAYQPANHPLERRDQLLGPGAFTDNGAARPISPPPTPNGISPRISASPPWPFTVSIAPPRSREGSLCTSCATLALNGTVQTNGMTTPVAGTNLIPLNLPLTAANCRLDVANPAATNPHPRRRCARGADRQPQLDQPYQHDPPVPRRHRRLAVRSARRRR